MSKLNVSVQKYERYWTERLSVTAPIDLNGLVRFYEQFYV